MKVNYLVQYLWILIITHFLKLLPINKPMLHTMSHQELFNHNIIIYFQSNLLTHLFLFFTKIHLMVYNRLLILMRRAQIVKIAILVAFSLFLWFPLLCMLLLVQMGQVGERLLHKIVIHNDVLHVLNVLLTIEIQGCKIVYQFFVLHLLTKCLGELLKLRGLEKSGVRLKHVLNFPFRLTHQLFPFEFLL